MCDAPKLRFRLTRWCGDLCWGTKTKARSVFEQPNSSMRSPVELVARASVRSTEESTPDRHRSLPPGSPCEPSIYCTLIVSEGPPRPPGTCPPIPTDPTIRIANRNNEFTPREGCLRWSACDEKMRWTPQPVFECAAHEKSTHACTAARAPARWIGGSPRSRALLQPASKLHLAYSRVQFIL